MFIDNCDVAGPQPTILCHWRYLCLGEVGIGDCRALDLKLSTGVSVDASVDEGDCPTLRGAHTEGVVSANFPPLRDPRNQRQGAGFGHAPSLDHRDASVCV